MKAGTAIDWLGGITDIVKGIRRSARRPILGNEPEWRYELLRSVGGQLKINTALIVEIRCKGCSLGRWWGLLYSKRK